MKEKDYSYVEVAQMFLNHTAHLIEEAEEHGADRDILAAIRENVSLCRSIDMYDFQEEIEDGE